MIRYLAALVASGFVGIGAAGAGEAPEAEAFIVDLVTELKANAEAEGEGSIAVRETLEANLASEAIGKFLLAGKAADSATDRQTARYRALFPKYIAAAYAEEIGQLASRDIRIDNSIVRRPGDVLVESRLFNSRGIPKADIVWRVRVADGTHKLLDVLVEGTSPLITRRQVFSERVRQEGIEGLLTYMEETIAAGITIETDAD